MLRQAPNVILVGEIRDVETADMAIQASLTGHLVFSTLHTNDAPSSITRLIDMGVQPFLAATAIQGVLAQRLVRRLCNECAQEYSPDPAEVRLLGLKPEDVGGRPFRRARGCRACDALGYRGRVGLFELFEMDSDLRDLTFRSESLESIRTTALRSGRLRPLVTDGARKVMEGITTVTEVLRVCRAVETGEEEHRT
jgi:type IV pilus assembly protein PilB